MDIRQHINLLEAAVKIEELKIKPLPYSLDALTPCMSRKCVDIHYNILTKKYFKKYAETGDLFQKAGAVLHNDYFWPKLKKYDTKNKPSKELEKKIREAPGSLKNFKKIVEEQALAIQGNGWVFVMDDWQVQTVQNHVIKSGILFAIDCWEHSVVDWDFDRSAYIKDFWNILNWESLEDATSSN